MAKGELDRNSMQTYLRNHKEGKAGRLLPVDGVQV